MKEIISLPLAVLALGFAVVASPLGVCAADSQTASAPAAATTPAKLPYGAEDVLKLSRAQVNDDVIVNYVQNSGTVYNLGADDLVYLRKEGVSDRVINAMLDQRKRIIDSAGQQAQAQQAVPAQQPATTPPAAVPAPGNSEQQASTQQPAPVYVQPPLNPPASSVYVVPYPSVPSAYYGYYAPYYGYWGGPSISLGFRFGGGHYWGGYHGYHHHR